MLAGKPEAGNPQVRFDEGEQRDGRGFFSVKVLEESSAG
jgi:hypothetical protein